VTPAPGAVSGSSARSVISRSLTSPPPYRTMRMRGRGESGGMHRVPGRAPTSGFRFVKTAPTPQPGTVAWGGVEPGFDDVGTATERDVSRCVPRRATRCAARSLSSASLPGTIVSVGARAGRRWGCG
jgi:hypothetical protein